MDEKNLKEKIKIAKKVVEGEEEPIKTAAFQVIFSKLLDSSDIGIETQPSYSQTPQTQPPAQVPNLENGKQELAKQCGISVKELDDVLYFKDDIIKVVVPLSGSEPEKQVAVAKCILTAYEIVFKKRWVKALVLSKCVDLSGVGQLPHLAHNLRKDIQSFRLQGKGKATEYKITGPGRTSTLEIIKKLAKNETIEEIKNG